MYVLSFVVSRTTTPRYPSLFQSPVELGSPAFCPSPLMTFLVPASLPVLVSGIVTSLSDPDTNHEVPLFPTLWPRSTLSLPPTATPVLAQLLAIISKSQLLAPRAKPLLPESRTRTSPMHKSPFSLILAAEPVVFGDSISTLSEMPETTPEPFAVCSNRLRQGPSKSDRRCPSRVSPSHCPA
jgi:hypothetical protein